MEPSNTQLYGKVMAALGREARLTAYRRFGLRLAALVTTAVATALSLRALLAAAAESGFFAYASLLFSDGAAVLGSRGDFAAAVLESLPVAHAAATALFLLLTLWSLAATVREGRGLRYV